MEAPARSVEQAAEERAVGALGELALPSDRVECSKGAQSREPDKGLFPEDAPTPTPQGVLEVNEARGILLQARHLLLAPGEGALSLGLKGQAGLCAQLEKLKCGSSSGQQQALAKTCGFLFFLF